MPRTFSARRRELTALRIAAQCIDSAQFSEPAAVVRHLVAMQAQNFVSAKWAIGVRSNGISDAAVETALANREFVRSWPMRGTLHFVASEDLGWMLALTAERTIRGARTRFVQLGIDSSQLTRANDLALEHLTGGRVLDRPALMRAFEEGGLDTSGQRGTYFLWYLSISRVIVFGPRVGKLHSFVLLDEWVSHPRNIRGDEALAEFAQRYFIGHGPATIRDFAWWSSLTLSDARRGLSAVRDTLDSLVVDGTEYFLGRDARAATSGVHLLPGFDEYILGYQDRSAPMSPEVMAIVVPGGNGIFQPTVVVDGEVVGTWRSTTKQGSLAVQTSVEPPLSPRNQRLLAKSSQKLAVFNEMRSSA